MALQNPTDQSMIVDAIARSWWALRQVILDPTVVRWAHPIIVVSLVFAQIGGGGRIATPVLVGLAVLVLAVAALQTRLHTSAPKVYDAPHLVQPLATLLLIVALALLSEPLPLTTLIGVVAFEAWLEVLAGLKRLLPAAVLPPLRWVLPFLATFVLLASFRTQQPLGVVVVLFVLPLWTAILPEAYNWEI